MSKLTPQQAIEQGYTHYMVDQIGEYAQISDTLEPWFKHSPDRGKILLVGKERIAFSISADTIQGVLEEYIDKQEDFFDEDDSLVDELSLADFDKIADLVNAGFKKRFMFPTEIELDLSGLGVDNG